ARSWQRTTLMIDSRQPSTNCYKLSVPMMGFLLNAGVGKDVGSCATHMNAVGCHLPFSAVVSLGEHKASGPQAAARSRMGLWREEVYTQYFSLSPHSSCEFSRENKN